MAIPVLAAANALGAHVGGEPAISENRPSLTTIFKCRNEWGGISLVPAEPDVDELQGQVKFWESRAEATEIATSEALQPKMFHEPGVSCELLHGQAYNLFTIWSSLRRCSLFRSMYVCM